MTTRVLYKYLGTNGVIESPIHLEDIYYIRINILTAENGKILTDGKDYKRTVRCSDEEISKWTEVALTGQN